MSFSQIADGVYSKSSAADAPVAAKVSTPSAILLILVANVLGNIWCWQTSEVGGNPPLVAGLKSTVNNARLRSCHHRSPCYNF